MGYYTGSAPAFTVGTPGVPLQMEVPSGFAASASSFSFVFEGLQSKVRFSVTVNSGTSANGNPCMSYVTTGLEFTVADVYLWELQYTPNGFSVSATDIPPFGQLVVADRL